MPPLISPILIVRNLLQKMAGGRRAKHFRPGGFRPDSSTPATARLWLMAGGAFAAILSLEGMLRLSGSF